MYSPLNYEQINSIAGQYHPSGVKSYNNRTFLFWERALFQRALSVIDYDEFPEEWNGGVKDLFEYCLLTLGFVPVFEIPQYGKTFNPGTLSGYSNGWEQNHGEEKNFQRHSAQRRIDIGVLYGRSPELDRAARGI